MTEMRRVSASRLNSIDQCTMKFYMNEILRLPEKTWPRTSAGVIAHSVLECLARDKHRAAHDAVVAAKSIYGWPAIKRLVRAWQHKTRVDNEIIADIDPMCMVAISHTNFLDEGATKRFDPEHEFKMTLGNGAIVKGFIDRMAQFPNSFVISDYKTARNKFTKAEVETSYQSLVYQLYVWKTFGQLAEVRYIFLRHGPTKLTPRKHIMVTKPATAEQLAGFEAYLEYMYQSINSFGLAEAHAGFCTDSGFCERVCSYRRPFDYHAVIGPDGQTISTHMLDNLPHLADNQQVEVRHCAGCPKFN